MRLGITAFVFSMLIHQSILGEPLDVKISSIQVNGVEISYRVAGQGPPLLLLHGFTGAGVEWLPILETVSRKNLVIVPDLRGHGGSNNPSGKFLYKDSALDMQGLLDHLGLESVSGIGYSAGSITLLHMASTRPEQIRSMVLLAGVPRLTVPVREMHREFPLLDDLSDQRLKYLREIHPRGDEQINALGKQLRAFADDYESFEFSPERLATITTRSLIVSGDRDEFMPISVITETYEAMPNAFLWIIPGGRHDHFSLSGKDSQGNPAFFSGAWWPPLEQFLFGEGKGVDVVP
jgi:pimeloyl-ACP methyl ester carboxylesterase